MKATDMLEAFSEAGKRVHIVGNLDGGVIIALDMEGRLFTVLEGEVLNRVNPHAIAGQSMGSVYLNPGGDGLWPAPEGTTLGYQYSTGQWRVPPALRSSRYLLGETTKRSATVTSEVDLVNNQGLGIPAIFTRAVSVVKGEQSVKVDVMEGIRYIGRLPLKQTHCLLAPWTLCQFDSGADCVVVFPTKDKLSVWDLYEEASDDQRTWDGDLCSTLVNGSKRYQIAISENVPWIEFQDPRRRLVVRREAAALLDGQGYIDIRDSSPDIPPSTKGVRYSIYSDTANFMEIEAVGGCPDIIHPDMELSVAVSTLFKKK